ncbi:hypothetical protein [Ichthyobacterium seriolicida]|uniref:Lipoprotein n=1 Tax=Ichthyobacterium seriolicida TaxID=242600 RepID=A0A1J1E4W6_9FLAO|nr:hypothetical protein [Ichthyobacterium seriolicida]BAV95100.1 hypothetical protein JBKA6_1087 [Ichthyobacterium seriolicida]
MFRKALIIILLLTLISCKYNPYSLETHQSNLEVIKQGVIDPKLVGIWVGTPIPGLKTDSIRIFIFRKDKVLNQKVNYYKKLKEFGCANWYEGRGNIIWSLKSKGSFYSMFENYIPGDPSFLERVDYLIRNDTLYWGGVKNKFDTRSKLMKLEKYNREMYDKLLKTDLPCMDLSTIYDN